MRNFINEIGKIYGKWTVETLAFRGLLGPKKGAHWNVKCQCGKKQVVRGDILRSGKSNGCQTCYGYSLRYPFTYNQEVLDGLMLGDGCLTQYRSKESATLHIRQTDLGLVEYIRNLLAEETPISINKKLKTKTVYSFTSTHDDLSGLYQLWYPNQKKSVPNSLKLSPTTVLHWFMGDGCTSWVGEKKRLLFFLSTNAFTENEVRFLGELLSKEINQHVSVTRQRNQFRLTTSRKDTINAFFDYMGECPVECMKYKWKRPHHLLSL